jgi:protein PhnA
MSDAYDAHGNLLENGDSVHVMEDVKVKGSSMTIKRGTVVKNIRTTTDLEGHIEARHEGSVVMLKTSLIQKKVDKKKKKK